MDLDPFVGNLEPPAGVVTPQPHVVGLQVAVGGVVVGARQLDGGLFDVAAVDDVVDAGEDEPLVDLPLDFVFQQIIHPVRLPVSGAGETSAQAVR